MGSTAGQRPTGPLRRLGIGGRPLALATLVALGLCVLLLVFAQLVRQSIRRGEQARAATAALNDASWRCRLTSGRSPHADCRQASR